ncbi:MAG: hydroxyacylglutathione hydrolase [Gammaproteobacteria bacterium]|jgi:hydroxyacylglutathione hydrolase
MENPIFPIPAFSDNYIWAFTDEQQRHACVVDPGDAAPVLSFLDKNDLQLSHILITHHHPDHTGGVEALARRFNARVFGPQNSPYGGIEQQLAEKDELTVLGFDFSVLQIPGHTLDHIAYYCERPPGRHRPLVFCGDTLFAAGCGRIFEGNPQMMYDSLQKLARLPADTEIYCTHEYTLANLTFAAAADPHNQALKERTAAARKAREQQQPTLPSHLALELATNPFLRCTEEPLADSAASHVGADLSEPVEVFAALRRWKDTF